MYIGLDFGTTNTSAAVYDGTTVRLLNLDQMSASPSILSSTLFIPSPSPTAGRSEDPYLGQAAINEFVRRNQGREINYSSVYLGSNAVAYADVGNVVFDFRYYGDVNIPGRFFKSLKTNLKDPSFDGTNVFGTFYSPSNLISLMLQMIRTMVERELRQKVTGVVIGCPVRYSEHAAEDVLAYARMQEACVEADLSNVTFLEEPVAAALSYALDTQAAQKALIFDFGGGTLDISVVSLNGQDTFEVLATGGMPLGGDLFNERIIMGPVAQRLGAGATIAGARTIPAYIFEQLRSWETIMDLSQSKASDILSEFIFHSDKPKEILALHTLIRKNYGLQFHRAIEKAKVDLSSREDAKVEMHFGKKPQPDINLTERIVRREYERLIGPDIRRIKSYINTVLEEAAILPSDIDVVLRTGGSSRTPRVVHMLAEQFGEQKIREMNTFTSVASGLAVAAWKRSVGRSPIRAARGGTGRPSQLPDNGYTARRQLAEYESSEGDGSRRGSLDTRRDRGSYGQPAERQTESLEQSFRDSRDGSWGIGQMRREDSGRFGSFPLHDDYSEESGPD